MKTVAVCLVSLVLAGCKDSGSDGIPCKDLPTLYSRYLAANRACNVDSDCTLIGGSSCSGGPVLGDGGGDPINVAAIDGAEKLLDRFDSTECSEYRKNNWAFDYGRPKNLRCENHLCAADQTSCLYDPGPDVADPGVAEGVPEAAEIVAEVEDAAPDAGGDVPPEAETDMPGDETSCTQCGDFYDCIAECPTGAGGKTCRDDCLAQMCPYDRAEMQGFLDCVDAHGCMDAQTDPEYAACIEQYCLDEYFDCFSGCGYLTCGDLESCLESCPWDDPGTAEVNEYALCTKDCTINACNEATQDFQAFHDCLDAACPACATAIPGSPGETGCNACQGPIVAKGGSCRAQWEKCAPHGTKTCAEVVACLDPCTDEWCAHGCHGSGTFTAQDLAQLFADCVFAACADGSPACTEATKTAACKTEWDACATDNATW
jgi:hypothetical protein